MRCIRYNVDPENPAAYTGTGLFLGNFKHSQKPHLLSPYSTIRGDEAEAPEFADTPRESVDMGPISLDTYYRSEMDDY